MSYMTRFYRLVQKNAQHGRGRRHYALASSSNDVFVTEEGVDYTEWATQQGYSASFGNSTWKTFGLRMAHAQTCLDYYFKGKPGYVISSTATGWPMHREDGSVLWLDPQKAVQLVKPMPGTVISLYGQAYKFDGAAFERIEHVND